MKSSKTEWELTLKEDHSFEVKKMMDRPEELL